MSNERQFFLDGSIRSDGCDLHGEESESQRCAGDDAGDRIQSQPGGQTRRGECRGLVVGLDMQTNDSFLMPTKQPVSIFADPGLHRQQREGFYGWAELGFAVLDNRRVLLGSF